MSNHLAIASVTTTLASLLSRATALVTGADVLTVRPGVKIAHMPSAGIHLYLYLATSNAVQRNMDLPARDSSGRVLQRPAAAVDLHYLLSFFGDELALEPQRLMGAAVAILHAHPVLSAETFQRVIDAAVAADATTYLAKSNIGRIFDPLRITPVDLNLDDLSKLWSVFFQTPYLPTVAYRVQTVFLEEELTPQRGLPVRVRSLAGLPIQQPLLNRVESADGMYQPIHAGMDVLLKGVRLKAERTRVTLGGVELTPPDADISAEEIRVTLPAGLRAGVLGAQVLHMIQLGDPPELRQGAASNLAPFILRPRIKKTGGVYAIASSQRKKATDNTLSGLLTLQLAPDVGAVQRVEISLNEHLPTGAPHNYRFSARRRTADGAQVQFDFSGVQSGNYLVRVEVDGAESALEYDSVEGSPTFEQYNAPVFPIT
jgi:hypothetical protein